MLAAASLAFLLAAAPLSPDKASAVLSARNLGLAQLEEGKDADAKKTFEKLGELVPGEALPFADAAVAALRMNALPDAEKLLVRAQRAAGGERADLFLIGAAIDEARMASEGARAAYARAAALDPRNLEARWRWVKNVEALPAPPPALRDTKKKMLSEIVAASPANLPARLKLLLLEIEEGAPAAKANAAEVDRLLSDADARTRQFVGETRAALDKGDAKTAGLKARILENLLRVTPRYQQSLGELFTNVTGLPVTSFSKELEAALRPKPGAAVPVAFKDAGAAAEDPATTLRKVDLANTGTRAPYAIPAPYTQALFSDLDLDGDLDVYLLGGGRPDRVVRNNMDGTFTDVTAGTGESEFASVRAVVSDVDRDGDPDLVAIDAKGELALRSNLRQGRFRTQALGVAGALDVAAEDLDADGFPDLAVLTRQGVVVLRNKGDGTFAREESEATKAALAALEPACVLLADLDNDGFPDLVVGGAKGSAAFRRVAGGFAPWNVLPASLAAERLLARDADGDGDLDLVAAHAGKAHLWRNDGGNANGWIVVAAQGLQTGSGKVNREGIGSLVEVKAGDLYVARTIGLLPVLVGLGTRGKADVVRVLFPNGVPQNAFDKRAKTTFTEVQQLKGSCPFVYARNGATGEWHFVSDALGNAPIGLLYDGVHLAGANTREWLLVRGDQLAPDAHGRLELDYTEELWEAAYLDEATLMAVDHPADVRVVPNERMVPFPLEKKLFTASRPRPVRALSTVRGVTTDVTEALRLEDHVYVSPGPETAYQGLRDEHALELDLGPIAAGDRVVLFLDGWIFYTDTSINVALSQRRDVKPFPPLLEVPDGRGGWKVAIEPFGFPAGKTKTMPVDLTGVVDPADPRVRLRTTSAIFWDRAYVTVNEPEVPVVLTPLAPETALLEYRGFSRRYRDTEDGPELFAHDDVTTAPAWEDVPGRLTRYGDVTTLLRKTDDRYVVFQGGDAIHLTYDAAALPLLPKGWVRDWVLVSDGWDKDFDKNTVTGQSVEPLPFHAMSAYPYPATERHPDPPFAGEWLTREASPARFRAFVKEHRADAQ